MRTMAVTHIIIQNKEDDSIHELSGLQKNQVLRAVIPPI